MNSTYNNIRTTAFSIALSISNNFITIILETDTIEMKETLND